MKGFLYFVVLITCYFIAGYLFSDFRANLSATPRSTTSGACTVESEAIDNGQKCLVRQPKYVVPILMFHYIRTVTDPNDKLGISLSVPPETFDKMVKSISDAGYQSISLEDFAAGKIKDKSIIFTFDDGYDDAYTQALPVLQKYNYTGTFFIIGDMVGKQFYMTKDQISEMKSAGMEIGGHTMSHVNLANTAEKRATEEISKGQVDRAPVMAFPSGKYSAATLEILKKLKIKAAVTTIEGLAGDTCDPLQLPRVRVGPGTNILDQIKSFKTKNTYCGSLIGGTI